MQQSGDEKQREMFPPLLSKAVTWVARTSPERITETGRVVGLNDSLHLLLLNISSPYKIQIVELINLNINVTDDILHLNFLFTHCNSVSSPHMALNARLSIVEEGIKCLSVQDAICCTDCKALWDKYVIFGHVNEPDSRRGARQFG